MKGEAKGLFKTMINEKNVKRYITISEDTRYPVSEYENALVFDLVPTGSITKRIIDETFYDLSSDENLQDNWFDLEAYVYPTGTLDLVVTLGGTNNVGQVDHFGTQFVDLTMEEEMAVLDEVRRQWSYNSAPNFKTLFKELTEVHNGQKESA